MAMVLPHVNINIDTSSVFYARRMELKEDGFWYPTGSFSPMLYMIYFGDYLTQQDDYLFVYEAWGEAEIKGTADARSAYTSGPPASGDPGGTFRTGLPTLVGWRPLGQIEPLLNPQDRWGGIAPGNTLTSSGIKPLRYVVKATTTPVEDSSISGTVLGPDGEPLIGNTIYLINTETDAVYDTTTTDSFGFYYFSVPAADIISENPNYKSNDPNPFSLRVLLTDPSVVYFGVPGYIPAYAAQFYANVSLGFQDDQTVDMSLSLSPVSLEIQTAHDLFNMRYFPDGSFTLMNDIDLENFVIPEYHPDDTAEWNDYAEGSFPPIRDFYSNQMVAALSLDGQGFRIQNIFIEGSSYLGLFSQLEGHVKNTLFKNVSILGSGYLGTIAGQLNSSGVVERCSAENVNITGIAWDVGGLVGRCQGKIEKSYVHGNIAGGGDVGGICGWVISPGSLIENCYAFGTVTATSSYAGGICSDNSGTIKNCYSVVSVMSGSPVGGITANAGSGVINSYYNIEIANQSDDDGRGKPRTTAQMTFPHEHITTYIDWDFVNIWRINNTQNDGYPFFGVKLVIDLIGTSQAKSTLHGKAIVSMNLVGSIDITSKLSINKGYLAFVKHGGVYVPAEVYIKANGKYIGEIMMYQKSNNSYQI